MIRVVPDVPALLAELLETATGAGGLGFTTENIKTHKFPVTAQDTVNFLMIRREDTPELKKDSPIDPALIEIQTQDQDPAKAESRLAAIIDAIDGLVEKDFLSATAPLTVPHTIMSTEHQSGPSPDKNEDLELARYITRFIVRIRVSQS